ncbi:DUF1302 domain-containing protein [Aliikangiella sp. IMCC44359]|uniref:DUF1302 domain-containing protein n=1 Tax=Aliikangiella sp. IMCC44359 TaxID=3459125 RepID=UPI00403A8703
MMIGRLSSNNKPKIAGSTLAVFIALSMGQTVKAVDIGGENWNGSWDTTVSFGAGWRVEEREDIRIGHSNLLDLQAGQLTTMPGSNVELTQGAWSNNGDDGNLNFDKGDIFSSAIKFTTELGLEHSSGFGFFIRGTGFYDFELKDNPEGRVKPISEKALEQQGEDYRLLDAYIYSTWDFDETALQARLGKQVVSWGESTFIQHGLSEINAVDLTKLRVPGAEIKEGLIPVNTLWTSVGLSESVNLEAFVQFEWEHFRTDEPGTYFATQDFTGESGTSIHLGFSQFGEDTPGTFARRIADRDADDSGQYGLKLSWLAENLNYTEFGFYYVNYHNKRPVITGNAHNGTEVTGFFEYIENIQMYAFSFNTSTDSGFSIAGEVTYRLDEPLQVDDVELLYATLEPVGNVPSGTSQIPGGAGIGEEISAYRLYDTVQYQATITKFMGPTWGADQWVLLAEVGGNSIVDMPSKDELRFNAPGTSRSGNPDRAGRGVGFLDPTSGCSIADFPVECEGVETNPFADEFSWGYRIVSKWDYSDVAMGWNMSPRIVFQHDVNGTTPGPISNFVQGRKAVTLGVAFDRQAVWKADIGYSSFFGAGTANLMGDRDFIAANISYSF